MKKIAPILIVLLFTKCSNLKYLNAYDGWKGKPKMVEISYYNVEKEFRSYGLSDLTRNMVGAAKIALSTLLIAGIWYQDLLFASSLAMALLMLAAQYFHFRAKHPWLYFVLSFILLILCLFIAAVSKNLI